jgi:2',3'-cyclic-nucleotide 2'-phosphodiesterase
VAFTLLCFGDVVGRPGRHGLTVALQELKSRFNQSFSVVNAENAAGGSGISASVASKIFSSGVDVITTGDHFYRNKEFVSVLNDARVLRPANYPATAEGHGWGVYETLGGRKIAVVNLMGRIFMEPQRCPFELADEIIAKACDQTRLIVVDMHAEATSEKIALGWYLDGRVSVVFGTHTHIQTADERILPGGTAYITDLGMTGPYDSVIGREKTPVLQKLRTGMPARFEVARNDVRACGVVVQVDEDSGKATSIERFQIRADAPVEEKHEAPRSE